MSAAESTTKDPVSKGFYNNYSKEISKKLLLPAKTDLVDSDLTFLNGYSPNLELYLKALRNTKSQKTSSETSWRFSQALQPDIINEEDTEDGKPYRRLRTLKIRILPNKKQEEYFLRCCDVSRRFKNLTYAYLNWKVRRNKKAQKNNTRCKYCKQEQEIKNAHENDELYDSESEYYSENDESSIDTSDDYDSEESSEENQYKNYTGISSFCCSLHKNKRINFYKGFKTDLKTIRDILICKQDDIIKNKPYYLWHLDATYATRQLAIKEALADFKSARTRYMCGQIKKFYLKQIPENTPEKSFWVDDSAIKISCLEKTTKKSNIKFKQGVTITPVAMQNFIEKQPPSKKKPKWKMNKVHVFMQNSAFKKLKKAIKLNGGEFNDTKIYNDKGYWFILVSYPYEINEVAKESNMLSIDPGVVIPLTGYRPGDGSCYEIGVDRMKKVEELKQKIQTIRWAIEKTYSQKHRSRMRKKIRKIYYKISCIVDDFHNQTASWIAKNHKKVLLPKLNTRHFQRTNEMTPATKQKLNSISHSRMLLKIKYLCHIYNTKFYVVPENHTSRTCPKCGHWNESRTDRTHKCACCNFEGNRDHVGSCNILIRTATVFRRSD
jgi:transposase